MEQDRRSVAIRAKSLAVGYRNPSGSSVAVLQDFDLDVPEGEFLTIIGPSGCGKSTFLRAVADLLPPLKGSLTVLGGSPTEARQRRDVSFVFQGIDPVAVADSPAECDASA